MTGIFGKIGIFDSGVGGLTVTPQIKKLLPNVPIIYIGDTARVPWGTRSPETVIKFSTELLRFLETKGVSLIVVACHTASAVAMPSLRKITKVPIIGVIEPTINKVLETTKGKVGIIGTPTTIENGAWEKALKDKNDDQNLEVFSVAAPLLVPIVEAGEEKSKFARQAISKYVKKFKEEKIDTLVLACTHYPLLRSEFEKELPGVVLINPGEETAKYVKGLIKDQPNNAEEDKFFFTDLSWAVRSQLSQFSTQKVKNVKEVKVE